VSIVEAARATSAAPTYFKPMRISTSTETKYFVYAFNPKQDRTYGDVTDSEHCK